MSKQRTRKYVNKILRQTCLSLVKNISDGENNFMRNEYNNFQIIGAFFAKNKCKGANMGSSIIILYSSITWCRPDRFSHSKFIIKTHFYVM